MASPGETWSGSNERPGSGETTGARAKSTSVGGAVGGVAQAAATDGAPACRAAASAALLGAVPPARPPPSPEALAALRESVAKMSEKRAMRRHGRAAELAGQAADMAFELVRTGWLSGVCEEVDEVVALHGDEQICNSRPHPPPSRFGQYGNDSLVGAGLRVAQVAELYNQANNEPSAADQAALDAESWRLLLSAVAAVQQRMDSGTFLPPDGCREEERQHDEHCLAQGAVLRTPSREQLRALSAAGGYGSALDAAFGALLLMRAAPQPAAERRGAEAFVLAVLDAIPQTAGLISVAIGAELQLVSLFQLMGERGNLDPDFHAEVMARWTSRAVADVLRRRGTLQDGVAVTQSCLAEHEARQRADVASRGFRRCGLPSCGKQEATVRHFRVCGGCSAVAHCCDEHHGAHWSGGHKRECRHLKAAGAKPPSTADAA